MVELPAGNPLFDPARHEPLNPALVWDEARVRACIQRITDDAEARFTPDGLWPPHPQDRDANDPPGQPYTPLYFGACGMVWALHHLQDMGAVRLRRDYRLYLADMQQRNSAWLAAAGFGGDSSGSYLMGDTPFALMACAQQPAPPGAAQVLADLITGTLDHPARELMWGAPGTLLAALHMHRHSGGALWADLFRQTAARLWSQLLWSEEYGCHYWQQDLYGQQSSYIDAVHGFVATALPLIQGRALLAPHDWAGWQRCIVNTVQRTATVRAGLANWRAWLGPMGPGRALLMQYCHGAPGFIICLADLPGTELDTLLLQAGEAVWAAGPLTKGANLCHGTGGNGYAFLKLYRRSGDALWLQRAHAFAMHCIRQIGAAEQQYAQQRYSLWTGDIGTAFYLWDCLHGQAHFPTLDRFFAPSP